MMRFRYQLLGHLLVAFIAAFLIRYAISPTQSEIQSKGKPFTTQEDMLMVRVKLSRDKPPELLEMLPLKEGRVSVVFPGDYSIEINDQHGSQLYSLAFQTVFVSPGDPPVSTDEIVRIFVLPISDNAARIVVSGPTGSDEAAIQR